MIDHCVICGKIESDLIRIKQDNSAIDIEVAVCPGCADKTTIAQAVGAAIMATPGKIQEVFALFSD